MAPRGGIEAPTTAIFSRGIVAPSLFDAERVLAGDRRNPNPKPQASLGQAFSSYLCLHRTSDLRVSIAALAKAVAAESPSKTRSTTSGESQARWIRLLT